jgi:PRTRC genetic system protein E
MENQASQIPSGFFSQMLPLLTDRTVVLIVAKADDGNLTVSVIPKRVKESENSALLTPMCCTGAADELDRDLPAQLGNFVAGYVRLSNNLAEIERERQEAEKAAREQARAKQKGPSAAKKNENDDKAQPTKPAGPPTPPMLSLFDTAGDSATKSEAVAPARVESPAEPSSSSVGLRSS